ncbi:MAG: hypothetical protein ACR2O6_05075 [Ilumatobacteraceae bacterium]
MSTTVPEEPVTEPENATAAVSFASDVQPIVTETCARCHTGDGPGTQHVRFDTAGDIAETSGFVALAVETGFMPPWPAGGESVPFDHDWTLTDEEIAGIVAWDEAGAPLDVAEDEPMVPTFGVLGLQDPDQTIQSRGSYDGELGQPDEYRCLVYDPELEERAFLESMEFIPQQAQVVHHAVGFLLSDRDRARIDEIDGADGQGGWTCFGFSPGSTAEIVFTWAPGQTATTYPEGSGLEMEPGDFFVMQTHYHYDVEAPADQSTVAIDWADPGTTEPVQLATYLAPAEIPCSTEESGPLCDRAAARAVLVEQYGNEGVLADLLVSACGYQLSDFAAMTSGVADAACDQPVQAFGEIVSVFGHEHELGKSFKMTLNPDTEDEKVLLDIPVWDFDWQLIYEPTESIVVEPGDWIRIECSWDRKFRDAELEPAYVMWADGTDDEMCFSAVVTRPV